MGELLGKTLKILYFLLIIASLAFSLYAAPIIFFIVIKFDFLRFAYADKTLVGSSIAYSPNGEMLAVREKKSTYSIGGENILVQSLISQFVIREVRNGSLIRSLDFAAKSFAFSPDNSLIAAGSYDGKVCIWRISDGELLHTFNHKINVKSSKMWFLSFACDGKNIVTFTSKKVNVWNLANGTNRVLSVEFISSALSPDGKTLALGSRNKTVDLYRLEDLTLVKQLKFDRNPIGLKFSPDGKEIAITGYSSTLHKGRNSYNIHFYSVEDGSLLNIFYGGRELLTNITISPNGRYLAASYHSSNPISKSSFFVGAPRPFFRPKSYDRIKIWQIEDGKQLQTLRGHKFSIHSMMFSPDSKFLVSTGGDGKIRFWRMPPRNYFWLWTLGISIVAAFGYWQRAYLISWIN